MAWAMALPLGVWSEGGRGRWLDRACSLAGTSLLSVPDILLAALLLLLAARTGWLPVGGSGGAVHLVLPVVCLAAGLFPVLFRHVRAAVLEASSAPFVRAARSLGIPPQRLLFFHILPAAANSVISLFGLSLAGLFSSSLLAEVIFGWPGLGPLFLEAIAARDTYVILAIVLLSAAMLTVANLLADLLLFAADPRIRRNP
jgi:peptide/nickel transport system permease protein